MFGETDEHVGLEAMDANGAVHDVVDVTAESAEEQWLPHGSGHPELMVEKKAGTTNLAFLHARLGVQLCRDSLHGPTTNDSGPTTQDPRPTAQDQ